MKQALPYQRTIISLNQVGLFTLLSLFIASVYKT